MIGKGYVDNNNNYMSEFDLTRLLPEDNQQYYELLKTNHLEASTANEKEL